MNEKKNIDRLFQEKFRDFETAPNDTVWKRISESLPKKKKKRRVIALWWQVGGVAAVIVLLLTIRNSMFHTDRNPIENPVVEMGDSKENTSKNSKGVHSKTNKNEIYDNSLQDTEYVSSDKSNATFNEEQINSNDAKKGNTTNESSKLTLPNGSTPNSIVNGSNEKAERSQKLKSLIHNKDNKSKIVSSTKSLDKNHKTKITDAATKTSVIEDTIKNEHTAITDNTTSKVSDESLSVFHSNEIEKKEELLPLETTNKESIEEAIAAQERIVEKEDKQNRWSIAPNVAPVYFGSIGQGSSLDRQFNENSKSGNINMSYGITGAYALSKKLKIRTGVNRIDLNQTTSNVFAFSGGEFASRGTNNNADQINGNIRSKGTDIILISGNILDRSTTPEIFNSKIAGNIDQQFGFIEVPLELEYRLVDRKLGVNVMGGFSTFFLNQNEIYADVNGTPTLIGEATNISATSFSANLGLGLDYKLSKQWNIDLQPQFKYQINTFNNTSGNFRPFFIGVYTGLSFKF